MRRCRRSPATCVGTLVVGVIGLLTPSSCAARHRADGGGGVRQTKREPGGMWGAWDVKDNKLHDTACVALCAHLWLCGMCVCACVRERVRGCLCCPSVSCLVQLADCLIAARWGWRRQLRAAPGKQLLEGSVRCPLGFGGGASAHNEHDAHSCPVPSVCPAHPGQNGRLTRGWVACMLLNQSDVAPDTSCVCYWCGGGLCVVVCSPRRCTRVRSSAASDVYRSQLLA